MSKHQVLPLLLAMLASLILHVAIIGVWQKIFVHSHLSHRNILSVSLYHSVSSVGLGADKISLPPFSKRNLYASHRISKVDTCLPCLAKKEKKSVPQLKHHGSFSPYAPEQLQKSAIPTKAYKVPIAYPDFAAHLNIEGSVIVLVEVTLAGKVRHVSIQKKLGFGFDEYVLAKINQFQFEPALNLQGEPVDSILEHEVRFEVE